MTISKEKIRKADSESPKGSRPHLPVVPESAIRNPRVKVLIDFMKANLHRRISLAELGQAANLSPSHSSRLFKTQTGLSPGEYLTRLRMEKARHLLATSLLSVKQIMALAGYNSKSHFARHFRKSFGMTPSEYRKSGSTS